MGVKHRNIEKLTDTLTISIAPANTGGAYKANQYKIENGVKVSLSKEGFWLYDEIAGMNLAMRAPSEREALIEALTYYQKRVAALKNERDALLNKVNTLKEILIDDEDDDF